jgi:hypothetical protein
MSGILYPSPSRGGKGGEWSVISTLDIQALFIIILYGK